ncbi:unnamed protein product, partial [Ectocarpus sp. 12 AP-2014]
RRVQPRRQARQDSATRAVDATESQEETQEGVEAVNDHASMAQGQDVANSGDGGADQTRGGGLGEQSSSSISSSDDKDSDGDSDGDRDELDGRGQRGHPQWASWLSNIMQASSVPPAASSSDGDTSSKVSPSRGTVRHRPCDHDSEGPPPRRARLDGENDPGGHASVNGQEEDEGDALFSSSVGSDGGGEVFPEENAVTDLDDAPSEMESEGYDFDGCSDGVATPPPRDGVEERDDNVQDTRSGEISQHVDLGGGVEEAKGRECDQDPGNVGGTRQGTVDEHRKGERTNSVDVVGDDGSGGDLVIAGAGASTAGVLRLEGGRTCDERPVQDTQTHDSATLQVCHRGMDVVGSPIDGGGDGGDASPGGEGLPESLDNVRDTSVRWLDREVYHGGRADDDRPEGHVEYPCEGGVDGSGSASGGKSRKNRSDSGGHGMKTGRKGTTSLSDRGVKDGSFQGGGLSRGQGEDTEMRATSRLTSVAPLVGIEGGLNADGHMGRGLDTAAGANARGGSSTSEGRACGRRRFGLARPRKTGPGSDAGSSFVRVPRVSLQPQSMMELRGGDVDATAANAGAGAREASVQSRRNRQDGSYSGPTKEERVWT